MTEKDSFDEIVDLLREPPELSPELTRRVMAEIATSTLTTTTMMMPCMSRWITNRCMGYP